jgi:CRISPR-associated protein Csm3
MEAWKSNRIYNIKVTAVTGMHIGGSSEELKIGGTDNPVITTDYKGNQLPYIPGSSLKGKMRFLLESVCPEKDAIEKLFGPDKDSINRDKGIRSRLIFRDLFLTDPEIKSFKDSEYEITEIKGENTIDRMTSQAMPRFIERVKPGIEFEGELILMVYEGDDVKKFENTIRTGIKLLEDSYIGGNGTRGYGKVKIKIDMGPGTEKTREEYMKE